MITSGCMLNTEEIRIFSILPRLCAHQPFAVVTVYSFHHFFGGEGMGLNYQSTLSQSFQGLLLNMGSRVESQRVESPTFD